MVYWVNPLEYSILKGFLFYVCTMNKVPIYKISNYEHEKPLHDQIYVKSFSDHICEYDFIDTPHSHDFFLFVFCTNGHGKHIIDFKTYDFKPNRLFILKPGQIHHWNLSEDIEGTILFFKPSFYFSKFPNKSALELPLLRTMSSIDYVDLNENLGKEAEELFSQLFKSYLSEKNSSDDIFASYLNILIHHIHDAVEVVYALESDAKFHYLYNFENLLESHFLKEHKVSFYAKQIGVGAEHLNRLCKQFFMKSCKKIINERVALEAMRMLSKKGITIQSIAEELHFSDLSNFVKFFKREVGITPAKFRLENS